MTSLWTNRWRPTRMKHESSLKGRLGWQGLKAEEYQDEGPHVVSSAHFEREKIRWDLCPRVSAKRYLLDENIQLAERDILLMKDGAALGKLAYVDAMPGPACLNSHLLLLRPVKGSYEQRFMFHLMTTDVFQDYLQVYGTGATFLGVSQRDIGNFVFSLPPREEQIKIARFLDHETAQIDRLIEKQQELIALLKEKRQAVISHAVTKGLNPNAPTKDSGVEWLGQVPAHWKTHALRFCAKDGTKTFTDGDWVESPFITDSGVRLLQTGNVGIGEFREKGFRYISEDSFRRLNCTEVFANDVLICRLDGPVGRACLAPELGVRMITSVDNAILKTSKEFDPRFLVYTMTSTEWLSWIDNICRAGGGFRFRISRTMLGSQRVPAPPVEEQKRIADVLDQGLERHETLTAKAEAQIDLLQERRTALISAAVTGKIDVRGWKPPKPDGKQEVA